MNWETQLKIIPIQISIYYLEFSKSILIVILFDVRVCGK